MCAKWRDFNPGSPLPSTWTDSIEELLSSYAGANFRVEKVTNTTIRVVAGPGDDQVGISIDGHPRFNVLTVTAAHPGGVAGEYNVYVTSGDDTFGADGGGNEIITSPMTFGLKIGSPSGIGAEALSRKVATCTWDGVKITTVRQIVGGVPVSERPWEVGDVKASLQANDHPGWVKIDGRNALVRTAYPQPFTDMMVTLGFTGNGVSTFGVPDARGRTLVGVDSAGVRISNAAGRDLLESGGSEKYTLSIAEIPSHTHGYSRAIAIGPNQAVPGAGGDFMWTYDAPQTEPRGGDQPHPIMQPYLVINWFVFTGEGAAASAGGGGGQLSPRVDKQVVTGNLAAGTGESGAVALGAGARIVKVVADQPCRVRLYTTPAQRDTDAPRPITVDPPDYPSTNVNPNHGCMLELGLAAGHLTQDVAPNEVIGSNETPPLQTIAYRIDNTDVAAHVITVTFTIQSLE